MLYTLMAITVIAYVTATVAAVVRMRTTFEVLLERFNDPTTTGKTKPTTSKTKSTTGKTRHTTGKTKPTTSKTKSTTSKTKSATTYDTYDLDYLSGKGGKKLYIPLMISHEGDALWYAQDNKGLSRSGHVNGKHGGGKPRYKNRRNENVRAIKGLDDSWYGEGVEIF